MEKHKYISYRESKGLYTVKIKDENKKTVQKAFSTLDEALAFRNFILLQRNGNKNVVYEAPLTDVPTLKEATDIFIERHYSKTVAPSTLHGFQCFRKYVDRIIGKMKINKLDYSLWKSVLETIQEMNDIRDKGILKNVYRYKMLYNYFIERNVINVNPFTLKMVFKKKKVIKKRAFTKEEKRRFLYFAKQRDYYWYFLFNLYFQTGCRKGELIALQWKDVDFTNKCLHINKCVSEGDIDGVTKEYLSDTTKTPSSVRTIPISLKTALILETNYKKYKPHPEEFVFKARNFESRQRWLSLRYVSYVFGKIREDAGLDKCLTVHCIRHTFATELIMAGVDIPTVQRLGGWSTPQTLLNVYAHSNDSQARNALERVMFKQSIY